MGERHECQSGVEAGVDPGHVFHVHVFFPVLSGGSGGGFFLKEGGVHRSQGVWSTVQLPGKQQWQSSGYSTVLAKPTCSPHLDDRPTGSQEALFGEPLYPCQAQHRLQLIYLGLFLLSDTPPGSCQATLGAAVCVRD